jgi:hypothetical protein
MRHTLAIGLMLLSLTGCITEPKQVFESNVPAGLDREDVELAILLATGLTAPENETLANWHEYLIATLRNAGDRHVSRLDQAEDEDRWVFDAADGKDVKASYIDGQETLHVAVEYTHSSYEIKIVSSNNLNEAGNKIDPVANRWLSELKLRINRALGRVQLMKRTYHVH